MMSLVSCKDDVPVPIDYDLENPEIIKNDSKFKCPNVSWISGSNEYYDEISSRTSSMSSNISGNTSIIFMDMSAASTNICNLGRSYDNGSVFVIFNPQMDQVVNFMQKHGWNHMYPTSGDLALYAISSKGSYALHKPILQSEVEGTTEVEPGTEFAYLYGEEDVKGSVSDPYEGYDFNDIGYYLGPFVNWVNEVTSVKAEEDFNGYALYSEQKTYNLKLRVHKCLWSDPDYIQGPYSVSVNYKYKPMYVFADKTFNPGDYYLFDATYISETSDIFKGNDFTHKHGGITVHICGAFLRELYVLSYIDGDGTNPKFISGFEPIPESDINTKDYTKTHQWNIGGGATGGYSNKEKGNGSISFDWGVSNTNTVSYTVSDLGVSNNMHSNYEGHGAAAAWTFAGQNLPGPKGDKGFNSDTPLIARSSGIFHTSWVWHSGSHKEGDKSSIGNLVTVINPVLGGAHNGLCVDGEKNTWKLDEVRFETEMVVPFRIPFGTARINNSFKNGEVISDVIVTNIETGEVVFKSSGDFGPSKPCEFSAAEGTYDIAMNVTDSDKNVVKYRLINPIQQQRRKVEDDIYDIDGYLRFQPEEGFFIGFKDGKRVFIAENNFSDKAFSRDELKSLEDTPEWKNGWRLPDEEDLRLLENFKSSQTYDRIVFNIDGESLTIPYKYHFTSSDGTALHESRLWLSDKLKYFWFRSDDKNGLNDADDEGIKVHEYHVRLVKKF